MKQGLAWFASFVRNYMRAQEESFGVFSERERNGNFEFLKTFFFFFWLTRKTNKIYLLVKILKLKCKINLEISYSFIFL